MQNTKILEMLNNGQIEELKALLQDEIYNDSLGSSNEKKRYNAMKRYFKYADKNANKACGLPCKDIEILGEKYNSFVDGFSLVVTTESIGEMESYDNTNDTYLKIDKMIDFSLAKSIEKVNINAVIAEAKSKGYKYKKSEIGQCQDFKYIYKYKDGYFKIGILDQAFSIIDDGKDAEVYYISDRSLLLIKTDIGIAGILPFYCNNVEMNNKTIIEH